tara:strand:+ start:116 stop:1006 length:891 start_codon:yes stop_codon:yes gene_type:complete
MKIKLRPSFLSIISLTIFIGGCSTPSKIKKGDSGQFRDEVTSLDSKSAPELHSSSALLLKYQERIQKTGEKRGRGPASVESAESFLEEVEEDDEEAEFKALTEEAPEKAEDKKEETLADIEGEATDEELLQDLENENSGENSKFEIDTPDDLKDMIVSQGPSPFELKELPPELKKGATVKSILESQIKDTRVKKDPLYKSVFPHKVPEIKDGSLLSAAKRATVETLRYLLGKGLNINYKDAKGNSALHYAVYGKRYENIKYLLKKGADPLAKNNQGLNPKEAASKKGEKGLEILFP